MHLVACSRMYNVAPGAERAWRNLFCWLSRAADIPLDVIEHPAPAPLEALWCRPDLGAAFMCGYPFALHDDAPVALAAPIPASSVAAGRPWYASHLVVRADSAYSRLADTYGGRLGWTVANSQSGYHAVRSCLTDRRREGEEPRYAETVGPLLNPRGAITAVLEDRVDVAPVDSYAFDLLRLHAPELTASLRILTTTAPTPMPLLIASREAPAATITALRRALLSLADTPEGRRLLQAVALTGFAPVSADEYRMLPARANRADRDILPVLAGD
jgi:ABC-type phosphate/phosphonate transport system substrate-binding protein